MVTYKEQLSGMPAWIGEWRCRKRIKALELPDNDLLRHQPRKLSYVKVRYDALEMSGASVLQCRS